MPAASAIVLLMGGLITLLALGRKKEKGWTTPVTDKYTPKEITDYTEIRPTVPGRAALYIKATWVQAFAASLAQFNAVPLPTVNGPRGPIFHFRLSKKGQGNAAGMVAAAALGKGYACLVTIAALTKQGEESAMVLCPDGDKSDFADPTKYGLAILADNTQPVTPVSLLAPPGTPVQYPPPQYPPDDKKAPPPPDKGPPAPWEKKEEAVWYKGYDLDPGMSEAEMAFFVAYLEDDSVSVDSIKLGILAAEKNKRPRSAKHLKNKLAKKQKAPPPGGKTPGTTTPGTTDTAVKYTIKKGDIAWSLAQKYAGDGNRWKEIVAANPQIPMKVKTTSTPKVVDGKIVGNTVMTVPDPWHAGLQINWPSSWKVPS